MVVLIGDVHPRGMDDVERRANVRYVRETELADALPGADVLFMWDFLSERARRGVAARPDGPAWVHIASAGVDRLLFPGLVESDTVVTNSRGVFDEPIAEYVLGLVLAFAKDLHTTCGSRPGAAGGTARPSGSPAPARWSSAPARSAARSAAACRPRAWRSPGPAAPRATRDPDLGVVHPMERLDEALAEADYVVLAAPLTAQTRGMIDAAALAGCGRRRG